MNALKAAAGRGGEMRLFGTDYDTRDGTCIRDCVHVMDFADAHLAALDKIATGEWEIIANLGTSNGASVLEMLKADETVKKRKPRYKVHTRREGDAPALLAYLVHAREILGFEPKRSDIETLIADAWRFHKARWGLRSRPARAGKAAAPTR